MSISSWFFVIYLLEISKQPNLGSLHFWTNVSSVICLSSVLSFKYFFSNDLFCRPRRNWKEGRGRDFVPCTWGKILHGRNRHGHVTTNLERGRAKFAAMRSEFADFPRGHRTVEVHQAAYCSACILSSHRRGNGPSNWTFRFVFLYQICWVELNLKYFFFPFCHPCCRWRFWCITSMAENLPTLETWRK